MNIGDKVIFVVGCAGKDFSAGKGDVITVNTRNANWLEDQLRAGYAKMHEREDLKPDSFRASEDKIETPSVLPDDPKPQKRGGRRAIVSG